MLNFKRIGLLILAAAVLLATALFATGTGISDLWVRFPDGTVQTTAAHNCFNPDDRDDEMIRVGGICIDKYEASLWDAPVGGNPIPDAQIDTYCPDNGQPLGNDADCEDFYARSVAGVRPAATITWFQAQQALANSGKRLPTSAEWQMAVSGTPDSTLCNVDTGVVANTGANPSCVSRHGAFDMVGNLWEWVADWGDDAANCTNWSSTYGNDLSCVGLGEGEINSHLPGALIRGGSFSYGAHAGPFAVLGFIQPSSSNSNFGFRGAR